MKDNYGQLYLFEEPKVTAEELSKVFIIEKPVKREVFAASFRDRIVHHLIINSIGFRM